MLEPVDGLSLPFGSSLVNKHVEWFVLFVLAAGVHVIL